MKIKVRPEDFVVLEEAAVALSPTPDRFAVFALTKREWDTFDLVDLLARRLRVGRQDIHYGGIKDRFGLTEQLISVRSPGRRLPAVRDKNFSLEFRGFSPDPITARSVAGNRFTITIRDIEERLIESYCSNADSVRTRGFPNYYDEQRFGSARHGKGFMGKELFLGRREKALRLYFTPSRHDDRRTRQLKTCAIEHWSHWSECLGLAFGEYRKVLNYLRDHRSAFTRAISLLDHRFLVFVLNAYQSFLFNEILGAYLRTLADRHDLTLLGRAYRWGTFLFHESLTEELFAELRERLLPVPGHDTVIRDETVRELVRRVLAREGIELADLKAKQLSRVEVHGIERPMLVLPQHFSMTGIAEDELYPKKKKMTLEFFLPRGSYATLILKRLEAVPVPVRPGQDAEGSDPQA